MTYYLIVGNALKGVAVNISTLPGFQNLNPNRLEDIVQFTNSFADEAELNSFLKYHGVLAPDNDNLTYGIYRLDPTTQKLKKLQLGISFANEADYFDAVRLAKYYRSKVAYPSFFKSFVNRYYSIYNAKKANLPSIHPLHYMPGIYAAYSHYIETGFFWDDSLDLISDFVTKYARDFTGLRDLAMFAISTERKKNNYKSNMDIISEKRQELEYYKYLLSSGDVTTEQKEAYENYVKEIEDEIESRFGRS